MSGGGEINGQISQRASGSDSDSIPENQIWRRSYISRVNSQLCEVNEKAYEPVLVSIGPYHYEKRKNYLRSMEKHKLHYQDVLMRRRRERFGISESDQLREYAKILEELEDEARSYYEEAVTLDSGDFRRMLLVDAFFIIELFQRAIWSDYESERKTDPLFRANGIIKDLKRDLILVENQIPFFVLKHLYPIIGDMGDPLSLICMAVNYLPIYEYISHDQQANEVAIASQSIIDLCKPPFTQLPSPPSKLQSRRLDKGKLMLFKHLLDLTRKFMLIEETLEIKESEEATPTPKHLDKYRFSAPTPEIPKYKYSATELQDFGVTFRGIKKSKFYEIQFVNGVLEIPVFNVDDITATQFRNLIAYEEHVHCEGETIDIVSYMTFMDDLINTAKDVKLLRRYGIIEHDLDNDKEIATMFNMTKNVIPMSYHYYGGIVEQIMDHCMKHPKNTPELVEKARRVWNSWMENTKYKLMLNFLNAPWKFISAFAAIVLLVLTLLQTVYSGLSYYKS